MKDRYGHDRGPCLSCSECDEFMSKEESVRCGRCGCIPVSHQLINAWDEVITPSPSTHVNDIVCLDDNDDPVSNGCGDENIPILSRWNQGSPNLSRCGQSSSNALGWSQSIPDWKGCCYFRCPNEVYFDINTGVEYPYCEGHLQQYEYDSRNNGYYDNDVIIVEDIETQQDFQQQHGGYGSSGGNNSISVCTDGASYSGGGNLLTHPPVAAAKCAIAECTNSCYIDENGTVHECCGYNHAMEHQRRQALQKALNGSVVKGITHCLLPECNNITWPFENYCGRTHADAGKQRGLIPPNTNNPSTASVTSTTADNVCILPNCTSPKYKDTDGTLHPYCGQTHAQLARQLGIFPTADKAEEQCELEGCSRPRYQEAGGRTHEYCCIDHARKDAPNRDAKILTSVPQVNQWLSQFSGTITVVSLVENDQAKPGGALFKKFRDKMMALPKNQRKTCLAFHGSSPANIQSICKNGFDPSRRSGQSYGPGEYFATTPNIPLGYCHGGKQILVNELLLGQSGTHHTRHGDIVVMKDPAHDLPRFILTFK